MKNYLLFAGDHYYPSGGWDDFREAFETWGEADQEGKGLKEQHKVDWYHVVDLESEVQ